MRIDPRAFGMAAGLVAAVLFILCAVAVWLAPEATTAAFGMMIHADLTSIARTLTLGSFVAGLVCWTLGTGLTFGVLAALYNGLLGPVVSSPR